MSELATRAAEAAIDHDTKAIHEAEKAMRLELCCQIEAVCQRLQAAKRMIGAPDAFGTPDADKAVAGIPVDVVHGLFDRFEPRSVVRSACKDETREDAVLDVVSQMMFEIYATVVAKAL